MARELTALLPSMESLLVERFDRLQGRDLLAQMTEVDLHTYLPGDILTKVDRMSMSVSLEARVPLLDHHIVEFASSMPSELKWRDGAGKWLLREAIRGLVPPRVLSHPKRGFGVPLARWFREPLRHRLEALRTDAARIRRYVDHQAMTRLIDEHLSGRRDHSHVLWRLLALEVWLAALDAGRLSLPSQLAGGARAAGIAQSITTLPA